MPPDYKVSQMLGGADLPYHKMAGSSGHAVLPNEDLETKIASVYQVQAHQSDLSPLRELLLHDSDLTKWVMDLVDKWVAGVVKMRVFTDKWPDCSSAVISFQEWLSHDLSDWESELIFSFGIGEQSHKLLCQPGVIDWTKMTLIIFALEESIAENLIKTLYNPRGRELGCLSGFSGRKFVLHTPISRQHRSLPEGFVFQNLQPSDAEYIAQYWPHRKIIPTLCIPRFKHCISVGSVGVFTDTTPPLLISWVIRDLIRGAIHHLYTLEEYRGRGLASAVVREMSSRIQDEGQVPFCYIIEGNDASIALFKRVGFVEQGRYSFMRTTKE